MQKWEKMLDDAVNGVLELDVIQQVRMFVWNCINNDFVKLVMQSKSDNDRNYHFWCVSCKRQSLSDHDLWINFYGNLEINDFDWLNVWSWSQIHRLRKCFDALSK